MVNGAGISHREYLHNISTISSRKNSLIKGTG